MARAQIKINGTDSRFTVVTIGGVVSLSNDDSGGETTYAWQVVDQPEGTTDALSATNVRDVTITPTKEGSYELLLTVNGTLVQTAVVAVLDARTGERIPAATETTESGAAEGWALAMKRILARALHAGVDANVVVTRTPGGIAAGALVSLTSVVTINAGTQAAFDVPSIAAALGTSTHVDRIGVLVDGVTPGSLGAGALVLVRMYGLVATSGVGSPAAGDPVYLGNTGAPSLTPGTVSRLIGHVVSSSGGSYRWVIDAASGFATFTATVAGLAPASGGGTSKFLRADGTWVVPSGTLLGVQEFTANGTYTPIASGITAEIEVQAAGGGGGCATTSGVLAAFASGGAGGVCLRKRIVNVTAGGAVVCPSSGGAGGASAGANGTAGGDASIAVNGTTYTAKGGGGGQGTSLSAATVQSLKGGQPQAGSTTGAGITLSAWPGCDSVCYSTAGGGAGYPGGGGGSRNGVGGTTANVGVVPSNAIGFGSGGAGAVSGSSSNTAGEAGRPGIVRVYEYAP